LTDPIVVDASALVALLVDAGETGEAVASAIVGHELHSPDLALADTANVLRRQELAGRLQPVEATLAHADLLELPLRTWPYTALAERAWELRGSLTAYDAAYVAVAELLGAPLLTLDTRLSRGPGPRCHFLVPG
jgi:predicted nucleic acid-binding protein